MPCPFPPEILDLIGLSPAVRSLRLESTSPPHSEVFSLLCSFPPLEDFALNTFSCWNGTDEWDPPLTSTRLTGSLELYSVTEGIGPLTRQLLDLPSGLNFTKIVSACVYEADLKATTDLVSGCSDTIEFLDITDCLTEYSGAISFDLSTATKLKELMFQCSRPSVHWITMALQTVRSTNLRQVTIRPYPDILPRRIVKAVPREWEDLDRLLVQFLDSHSIRTKFAYGGGVGEGFLRCDMQRVLPELTRRGHIDLVEYNPQSGHT